MFKHDMLSRYPLEREDTSSGRYYNCDGKKYPSVTTLLNSYYDNSWLEIWKNRVGEDKANRISTQARNRGTAVHSVYERFLLNEDYVKGTMPVNLEEFYKLKDILEENISVVHGIELPLYSHELKLAGTTDAVATWARSLSVLDFKTAKRAKTAASIENYFIQTTIYGMMIEEMYGLDVKKIVIIMTVDGADPLIFERDSNEYREKVFEIVNNYYEANI